MCVYHGQLAELCVVHRRSSPPCLPPSPAWTGQRVPEVHLQQLEDHPTGRLHGPAHQETTDWCCLQPARCNSRNPADCYIWNQVATHVPQHFKLRMHLLDTGCVCVCASRWHGVTWWDWWWWWLPVLVAKPQTTTENKKKQNQQIKVGLLLREFYLWSTWEKAR